MHVKPISRSWLNIVERFFRDLTGIDHHHDNNPGPASGPRRRVTFCKDQTRRKALDNRHPA